VPRRENKTVRKSRFTRIMAGLTDVHEGQETRVRTSTDVLITQAEQVQDQAAASTLTHMAGSPMPMVWGLWRNPLGPDTAMGDVHIITEPVLGLTTVR
jgi:hypothetical protein